MIVGSEGRCGDWSGGELNAGWPRNFPALLARPGRGRERSIHVDDRRVEEFLGRSLPDVEPRLVDRLQQLPHVARAEPSAVIPRRGRIGNRIGADGVKERLVIASPLNVLRAPTIGRNGMLYSEWTCDNQEDGWPRSLLTAPDAINRISNRQRLAARFLYASAASRLLPAPQRAAC